MFVVAGFIVLAGVIVLLVGRSSGQTAREPASHQATGTAGEDQP
jgi:hypothetical protein